MEKVVSEAKMAQKMVACACKCQRRYEITSYCNKFLETEKLKQTFFFFLFMGGAVCKSRMLA